VLGWGAASGAAGGAGVALLYRALAAARMSVVAPITAVEAAAVPVLWGLLIGEQPGALALGGVVVALVAVVLVSAAPEAAPAPGVPDQAPPPRPLLRRPGTVDALGAGLAFGLFFLLLDRAGAGAGLWPLVAARVVSVGLLGGLAVARRRSLRPPPGSLPVIVGAGALDMLANLAYLLATGEGLVSLVAVLTSLYPASTVLLARVVLGERLVRLQVTGLGLAALGVVLITVG
jgi:drug/metabolite transporter (DMT)-like permease